MKKSYVLDGSELCAEKISGVTRYAYEILRHMDELMGRMEEKPDLILCYPAESQIHLPKLKNIPVEALPTGGKPFRSNVLRKYARARRRPVCSFGPCIPFSSGSLITVYDVRPLEDLNYDSKGLSRFFRLVMAAARVFRNRVVTISEDQKKRIVRLGKIREDRISVIGCGWDHILGFAPDEGIFQRFPEIRRDGYFYALGSLAKHKNFQWIYEVAKRNPEKQFVIAGNISREKWGIDESSMTAENIVFTGYVSDEENRALTEHCIAFLHPSKYEGFGLPPMEAMGLGKRIIVSDATCLPEIYEGYASFFDPDDYKVNLDALLREPHREARELLEKFTWKNLAGRWLDLLMK